MKKILCLCSIIIFSLILLPNISNADEIEDLGKEISNLQTVLDASLKATKPLESELNKIKVQIASIRMRIDSISKELVERDKSIKAAENKITEISIILNEQIKHHYIGIKKTGSSLLELIVAPNLSNSLNNFFYQKTTTDANKHSIVKLFTRIQSIEESKAKLQNEKAELNLLKGKVDLQSKTLEDEIGKAKNYQQELSTKIATLSTKQQQLIAQKLAGLNIPRSAATSLGGCSDDRNKNPGFSPRFALFTYGVPNRVGLNQYGAKGRAEAGQNEEDILRAYYENYELKKDYDTGISITVESFGSFNIEDYVKRIYEVPESWPMATLKAQAIAARTYALSYTSNGQRPICATQSCQVFKPEEKGGAWNAAVEQTRGWVMVQNGNPIKSWYSSTHGGYVLKSSEIGWSDTSWTKHAQDATSSINNFSDLQNNAYDKSSPWFYCDWGYRKEYNNTAWLKADELADIVNILNLVKKDASIGEHLYQVDKPNPAGTDTWDSTRVKQELSSRGETVFSNITGGSVNVDFQSGRTSSITLVGDSGQITFDAGEFKNWFNLRAPENIQIVGPLYNIEVQ